MKLSFDYGSSYDTLRKFQDLNTQLNFLLHFICFHISTPILQNEYIFFKVLTFFYNCIYKTFSNDIYFDRWIRYKNPFI